MIWFHTPHLPVLTGQKYKNLYNQYDENIQHFYGCITAMDEQIGRLVDELKILNEWDNTIIFFTSDNGPEGKSRIGRKQGSTRGLKGRKRSLLEGRIRVPGIMTWPGKFKAPAVINSPVSTSDYYPTVLDILNIKMPKQPQIDGVSFLPILIKDQDTRSSSIGFQSGRQQALISSKYKIYTSDKGQTFALYDIVSDPGESKDLSLDFPEIKDTLINQLNTWIESCKKSNEGHDYQ